MNDAAIGEGEHNGDNVVSSGRSHSSLRSLLLHYLLYDSLVKSTCDQVAPAYDAVRVFAWTTAVRRAVAERAIGGDGGVIAAFSAPRELPGSLALALALSCADVRVVAFEPLQPRAAALRSAALENGALIGRRHHCAQALGAGAPQELLTRCPRCTVPQVWHRSSRWCRARRSA